MKEYRDYIELWVHETKTPIASAQLALSNLHGPEINEVRGDLDRIESRVEQALYYARSATLSEDFSIEELNLVAIARKACRQRSRMLIGAGVSLDFAIADALEVLADAKWTDFIIGQALENSAKYGAKTIRFEGAVRDAGTKGAVSSWLSAMMAMAFPLPMCHVCSIAALREAGDAPITRQRVWGCIWLLLPAKEWGLACAFLLKKG